MKTRLKHLKHIFPESVYITQEMIDTADITAYDECIGAKALRKVLTDKGLENNIAWGTYYGYIYGRQDNKSIRITTTGEHNMMCIKSPQAVTFILALC